MQNTQSPWWMFPVHRWLAVLAAILWGSSWIVDDSVMPLIWGALIVVVVVALGIVQLQVWLAKRIAEKKIRSL